MYHYAPAPAGYDPGIRANPDWNSVWAWGWNPGAELFFVIDDDQDHNVGDATTFLFDRLETTDGGGNAYLHLDTWGFQLQPSRNIESYIPNGASGTIPAMDEHLGVSYPWSLNTHQQFYSFIERSGTSPVNFPRIGSVDNDDPNFPEVFIYRSSASEYVARFGAATGGTSVETPIPLTWSPGHRINLLLTIHPDGRVRLDGRNLTTAARASAVSTAMIPRTPGFGPGTGWFLGHRIPGATRPGALELRFASVTNREAGTLEEYEQLVESL